MLQFVSRKASLPALLLLTAFGVFACERSGTCDLPNVILIVMDTARAENFSCYGYHRMTSPNIDAFAQEATFYSRAIASSPWTIPTHASMFTGKESFEHGAHRLPPGKLNRLGRLKANPLDERHATLAEVLAAEGFTTSAVVANSTYINERYKMDQGFQSFYAKHAVSDSINEWVYAWLDTLPASPFFLFINYMDTHTPYNMKDRPGFLEEPVRHDRGQLEQQLRTRIMQAKRGMGGAGKLRQLVIDQYDTAIANLDEQIGKLFAFLKEKGLYDRSLILLTSDHGEMFGEHHLVSHGHDLYQELLWVPFIIKAPGQTVPQKIEDLISTSDIPRIILSHLPEDLARKHFSQFPNAPGLHPIFSENYYAHPWLLKPGRFRVDFNRVRSTLIEWPYKYVHSSDDKHELYNLEIDWKESSNLIADKPDVAEQMAARLLAYKESRDRYEKVVDQKPLTEEEIKQLKSLGYIGN